jgi:hypothetical protein
VGKAEILSEAELSVGRGGEIVLGPDSSSDEAEKSPEGRTRLG